MTPVLLSMLKTGVAPGFTISKRRGGVNTPETLSNGSSAMPTGAVSATVYEASCSERD